MNFQPARLHKSVLEFYLSSGVLPFDDTIQTIENDASLSVNGNSQAYEQINLFIYGHLLPDYTPLRLHMSEQNELLRTRYILPQASHHAYHTLYEELSHNTRLDKLVKRYDAKIRTALEPAVILLDFPLTQQRSLDTISHIDFAELKSRYENLSIAQQLFDGFFSNARRHVDLLQHALADSNWQEIHRHVHALKGGAMNLAAHQLTDVCTNFESFVKNKEFTRIEEYISQVHDEISVLEQDYEANKEKFFV